MKQKTFEKDSVLTIQHDNGTKVEVVVLRKGEWIQYDHKHSFSGPSLVLRDTNIGCVRNTELDVDDPGFWKWIGMLVDRGLHQGKVTTPVQENAYAQ